ncbi:MAG: hypothetical protein ACOWW1_09310 [archaeon]|nr:hypothetical protein [Candidatus Bathyarchaeum sp.]
MEIDEFVIVALIPALYFMLIHFLSPKIYQEFKQHKKKIFSLFGGIAAAYVFVDLLPKLEQAQDHIRNLFQGLPNFVYSVAAPSMAFLGFMIFFGIEHLAISSQEKNEMENNDSISNRKTFAVHLGNILFINLIVGYLLRFEAELGTFALALYSIILSLHFITLDESMEDHYSKDYTSFGRYVAGLAPLVGWVLSVFFPENQSEGYIILAVVTGAVLFNSIKNEIPSTTESNVKMFFVGASITAITLFIVAWLRG